MRDDDTAETGRAYAIHHFEETGVILPGHAGTIAEYRADD